MVAIHAYHSSLHQKVESLGHHLPIRTISSGLEHLQSTSLDLLTNGYALLEMDLWGYH